VQLTENKNAYTLNKVARVASGVCQVNGEWVIVWAKL